MKWVFRALSAAMLFAAVTVFVGVAATQYTLAPSYYVQEGEALILPTAAATVVPDGVWETQAKGGDSYQATVKFLGIFPVAEVGVKVQNTREVSVCGAPFGVKMFTEGVLIVGIGDVDSRNGSVSPARKAGLRVGDSVLSIDGEAVSTTEQVAAIIEQSAGQTLSLRVRRSQLEFDVQLTPIASVTEACLKAGMWIRDSSAGIGTLTFFDEKNGVFAGLGHPVNDADTGQSVPISSGEIVPASVFGITKGQVGSPGELLGSFSTGSLGILTTNDDTGLYGLLSESPSVYTTAPIAYKQDVVEGEAQMITTIHGDKPKAYRIRIEKIDYRDGVPTQNMIIRVVDEELLQATGGVLCGMSGSPIIQNGKLVAAVTHVFVGDPTSGYAIFAENMLQTAQTVPTAELNNAA